MLLSLADQANKDGICWPGFASISRRCNIDRRTTIKAIKLLEELGYLQITRRPVPGKNHQSNVYQVMVPQGDEEGDDIFSKAPAAGDYPGNADGSATLPWRVVAPPSVAVGNHNSDSMPGGIVTQSHPGNDSRSVYTDSKSPPLVAQDHPGSDEMLPESLINHQFNPQRNPIEAVATTTTTSDKLEGMNELFRLYEENFGRMSPEVSSALIHAMRNYPAEWIKDAMKVAVLNNVIKWRYVEGVLKNWRKYSCQ